MILQIQLSEALFLLLGGIFLTALITWLLTFLYWRKKQQNRTELQQVDGIIRQQQVEFRNLVRSFRHEAHDYFAPIKGALPQLWDEVKELFPKNSKQLQHYKNTLGVIEYYEWRLTQLVENLDMLTRLEMPDHALQFTQVKLDTIVDDAIVELQPIAETNGVQLSWWAIPDDFPNITANSESLHWVLTNLVDNAIKYCRKQAEEKQEARIDVILEADTARQVVIIQVKDNGPGIPQDDLERIFQKGVTVEATRGRQAKGQGLGLYIVKLIVEKHRGHIFAESQIGQGTTFVITIPLQRI